jgi:hypothetical protein
MSKRMLCAVVCATLLMMVPVRSPAQKPADLPVDLKVTCPNAAGESLRIVVPPFGPTPTNLDFGFPTAPPRNRDELFQFWVGMFKDVPAEPEEPAGCLTLDVFGPALWSALAEQAECPECPAPVQRIISIPMLPAALPVVNIEVDLSIAPRVRKPARSMTFEIRAHFNNNKPQGDAACDPHWLAQARHLYEIGEQCRKCGDLDMARNCYQEVQLLAPQSSYAKTAAERMEELTCDAGATATGRTRNALRSLATTHWRLGWTGSSFGPQLNGTEPFEEQETQSPGDWWQERFLKAAREIQEERLRRESGIIQTSGPEYEVPPVDAEQPKQQVERAEHARKLYQQGEFHRRTGAARTALYYYKAAHAICPTCAFGERALKHIFAIEETLRPRDTGAGEESEVPPVTPPKKKDMRSRILEGTVPLEIYLDEMRTPLDGFSSLIGGDKDHQIRSICTWLSRLALRPARVGATCTVTDPHVYLRLVGSRVLHASPSALNSTTEEREPAIHYFPASTPRRAFACAAEAAREVGSPINSDYGFFGSIVPERSLNEPGNMIRMLIPADVAIDFYPPLHIYGDEEAQRPAVQREPLSTRVQEAARRLLDSLDLDVVTDGEAGLRIGVNLGGQRYQFHYSSEAWMVLMSPATAANR